jgi:hypothetical protein
MKNGPFLLFLHFEALFVLVARCTLLLANCRSLLFLVVLVLVGLSLPFVSSWFLFFCLGAWSLEVGLCSGVWFKLLFLILYGLMHDRQDRR